MAVIALSDKRADPDVVEMFETLLADARSGDITGFACVCMDDHALRYSTAGIDNRFLVVGYLTNLIYKLNSRE